MVLLKGLEPLRLTAREPKSRTSAYSATATYQVAIYMHRATSPITVSFASI